MVVCVCKNIDDKKIKELVDKSQSFEIFKKLCEKEGLGSSCGICLKELYELYH